MSSLLELKSKLFSFFTNPQSRTKALSIVAVGGIFGLYILSKLRASNRHHRSTRSVEDSQTQNRDIKPFSVSVSEEILSDLQNRLKNVRFPNELEGADWKYGTNLKYLKGLVKF